MKIVRFKAAGKTRYGILDGTYIVEYSGTPYGTFKRGRKRWPVKQAVRKFRTEFEDYLRGGKKSAAAPALVGAH